MDGDCRRREPSFDRSVKFSNLDDKFIIIIDETRVLSYNLDVHIVMIDIY